MGFPIPRLGQGSRGGAAGLIGLPGGPAASLNPGLPPLRNIPRIAPPLGESSNLGFSPLPGVPRQQPQQIRPNHMNDALRILHLVDTGQLEPTKAASLLDGLNPLERRTLTQQVLQNQANTGRTAPTGQLQALRYLPVGKNPGSSAGSVAGRKAGVGTNLLNDIGNSITGIPAGLAVAGKAVGQDLLAQAQGKAPTHTYDQVIKPVAKSYAAEYGPLAHGDFSGIAAHPLAPVLDALTLASAGLGGAARVGAVGDALRAGKVADLAGGAKGIAKVGDQYTVHELKNGTFGVREGNQEIAANLPDKQTAIAHAQSLISPHSGPIAAALKTGGKGALIDRYEDRFRPTAHEIGDKKIADELQSTMEDPNLKTDRRSLKQTFADVKADLAATAARDKATYNRISHDPNVQAFSTSRAIPAVGAVGGAVLREAFAGVKAGAIYLRPAYMPNNWAGNFFMNAVHQGVLAPVNLAKSFVLNKELGPRYTAVIDKGMGTNAAEALRTPKGRGYISAATDPVVSVMGAAGDQPFRRAAWLHEARRAGYNNLGAIKGLMDKAAAGDSDAYTKMAQISRKAQEEVVKFGDMNAEESAVARNVFFVYSWMKGATRYGARYAAQHPIQTNLQSHLSQQVGNPYIAKNLGGVPSFLHGVIPVGHDKNGNPILINPFALNPLGTAMQVGQAALGTAKVLTHPKTFNKYVDTDIAGLTAPLIQGYLNSREGGKSIATQESETFAPYRLYKDLQHPGSGSIFPTSRWEAIGHWAIGSMYPRKADAQALQRSLEREQRSDPVARMNTDIAVYKKAFGHDIPQSLIDHYKVDIQQLAAMKSFQSSYASAHGQSGFRNLPPQNRVEAATKFLQGMGKMDQATAEHYQEMAKSDDATANQIASALWSETGIGVYKNTWDSMLRDARGLRNSGMRK